MYQSSIVVLICPLYAYVMKYYNFNIDSLCFINYTDNERNKLDYNLMTSTVQSK